MPSIESQNRHQSAVLWPKTGKDNFGNPTLGTREEIFVRWEEKRLESKDAQTNPIATGAMVWVDPDQTIAIGDIMWLGTMEEWLDSDMTNIKEVIAYRSIPDIKGRVFEKTVTLQKYSDSLPALT